jgi:hypothetical protein
MAVGVHVLDETELDTVSGATATWQVSADISWGGTTEGGKPSEDVLDIGSSSTGVGAGKSELALVGVKT